MNGGRGGRRGCERQVSRETHDGMKPMRHWVAGALIVAAMAACLPAKAEPEPRAGAGPEIVVLLHGLARTSRSMAHIEQALIAAGYAVASLQYPSRQKTVQQIADEDLAPLILKCQTNRPVRIHFVAHSLGNIILRQYFTNHTLTNAGRIVMLGPPNQGSEVVDKLGRFTLFDWVNGPAGQQLGTSSNSLPSRLPAPPVEVGVIAGTRSINWLLSALIPGRDDGKVSVERAKLSGMADFAEVAIAHPFLMRHPKAIELTLSFLKNGSFANGALNSPPAEAVLRSDGR
jgi:triacylglycerol lipase